MLCSCLGFYNIAGARSGEYRVSEACRVHRNARQQVPKVSETIFAERLGSFSAVGWIKCEARIHHAERWIRHDVPLSTLRNYLGSSVVCPLSSVFCCARRIAKKSLSIAQHSSASTPPLTSV